MKIIFTIILLFLPFISYASEQELYDPAPPSDAAFVRIINASGDDIVSNITIGEVDFDNLIYPSFSDYAVVLHGKQSLNVADNKEIINIESGKYYTIAILKSGHKIIADKIIDNPAKAMIYFYNFTENSASLIAPQHEADIFKDVEAGKSDSRWVNAVNLSLAIMVGGVEIATFSDVLLKRRIGTSFALLGNEGGREAITIENRVRP